jgi:hypothetical protein
LPLTFAERRELVWAARARDRWYRTLAAGMRVWGFVALLLVANCFVWGPKVGSQEEAVLSNVSIAVSGPAPVRTVNTWADNRVAIEYMKLKEILPDAPKLVFTVGTHGEYNNDSQEVRIDPWLYRSAPVAHIRFVLAHELGHWLHMRFAKEDYDYALNEGELFKGKMRSWLARTAGRQDRIQAFADEFALTLMPEGFDLWEVIDGLE